MSLSSFSLPSLKTLKKSKTTNLQHYTESDIEISDLKQIGNYQLGQEIGSGAFGKVLLGKHITTEEKVAIKILDKIKLSKTPDDYQLVKQELSILKIVKHKYIVRLFEILETSRYIFIVMEYCEGGDIMNYIISKGRLSENESLKFFHQLINALFYLHSQSIAHRDVKIDNLLLDSNKDLKLIDFGLSTKYKEDELLNQPCGTIVYAAPEVLDYKDYHGMLADVWSCGIVLYGMLSGFLPFGDSDDEINKKMVLSGKIKMPNFFSEGAINLLKHMLDINPLTRFTLDDIMEHPWFNKIKYNITPGIIVGVNRIPVDEKIVDLCVAYNLDKDKVRNSVIKNKFNTESAVYYLVVQKMKKMGQDSVSDLCSRDYIKYMLNESNDILNNDRENKKNKNEDNIDEKKEKQITKQKNKIKILSELKKYYKIFNSDNNLDEYIDFVIPSESRNDNKKFINIENNFKNNIIIFNHRKKIKDINVFNQNRTLATQRINIPEINFRKNLLDNNDDDDLFFQEIMNRNSLETDRIITKGKLINNKILNNTYKIKKNVAKIRNKNFPLDKYLNNKYFNSLDNKNTKNKNIFKTKKLKNNKKFFFVKQNENQNKSQGLNKNKDIISPNSKNYMNKLKIKLDKMRIINLTADQNSDKINLLPKENINTYIAKSKILNQVIKIPHLNINQMNYNNNNNRDSIKKIFKKRKIDININNKSLKNKSEEKRNILNIQGNIEPFNKKMFINLHNKKQNASTIISNIDKKNKKEKDSQTNLDFNYNGKRQKISGTSLNNDKKANKINKVNLIDNIKQNINSSKDNNNIIQNKNENKSKKSFGLNALMQLDKNDSQNSVYNTNRQSKIRIYNLKKNNNLKFLNLEIRNKIKNLNLNNINNTNKTIVLNNKSNIINNSIIRNTINNINKNSGLNENITTLNQLNTIDTYEKCNTSRISVHLKTKKIKQRNLNRNILTNKISNGSNSSLLNNQTRTIFISNKKNLNNINFPSKLNIEQIQNVNNTITNKDKSINTNAESSSVIYKKRAPNQIRDLSDSARNKFLNDKVKPNKISLKLKVKVNDEKMNSIKKNEKYIQKINLNKNKALLKKIDINNHIIKTNKNNLNVKIDRNILKTNNNLFFNNATNTIEHNANKVINLKSTNKKYYVNINDDFSNSCINKKSQKNIKIKNINLAEIKKNAYNKNNKQSHLALNNDNINFTYNFDLSGKRIINNSNTFGNI